jgi:photosystem II stability/assembly factor-like uncharacterized protein
MRWQVAAWRRGLYRPVILGVLASVLLVLGWLPPAPARADAPDWEATPLSGKAQRLFMPASGALYAQVGNDLYRSDDAGATWTPISLPPVKEHSFYPFQRVVAVDSAHTGVLYANGPEGLYRSQDGGREWELVLSTADRVWHPELHSVGGADVIGVAVSPADPQVIYAGLRNGGEQFQFLRSTNSGENWEQIDEKYYSLCDWIVSILQAHLTDPTRVFRTADCLAGRNFNEPLDQSIDQGETWVSVFGSRYAGGDGRYLTPKHLVGGTGAAPSRFYMAAQRDFRFGGSAVLRSDDDAATWKEMLTYWGGGSDPQRQTSPDAPLMVLGGLAYDSAQPDHVYVAINESRGWFSQRSWLGSWLQASRDGGASWTVLDDKDIGAVSDLALSVDGTTLYAATDQGVFRMHLTP